MNKELTIVDFGNQLSELDKIQQTCKTLLQTKHYASIGEAGIHAIIARAKALGIHPFEALNGGFICIQGKVGMSTEMMAALVRQRGHSIQKDPKSNNEICILKGKRADNGDEWTCTFTKEDAMTAGLWNGPTWKKYPGVMLYNRCMSQLFRQLFPDISLGAGYVDDELKEITKTGDYKVSNLPEAEVEEIPEDKDKILSDFFIFINLPEEEKETAKLYLEGYASHYKLPMMDAVNQNTPEKFMKAFKAWKKKHFPEKE